MDFKGLLPTLHSQGRPKVSLRSHVPFVKDSASLSTWICLGAVLQGAAFLVAGKYALIPAAATLLFRMIDTGAITMGLKRNPYMDRVIMEKFSAQFPDDKGRYGNKASNEDVAVFMLGARSNHPMGMLAPKLKEMGEFLEKMIKQLEDEPVENGYLGHNSFVGAKRGSNNEVMQLMYFKNSDYVHTFAEGQLHREAMNWWTKIVSANPHLSIWHELYQVPKGHWESVYLQTAPVGASDTLHYVSSPELSEKGDGQETATWMSPIVDARRGALKSSAGRMGRDL